MTQIQQDPEQPLLAHLGVRTQISSGKGKASTLRESKQGLNCWLLKGKNIGMWHNGIATW